jgi:hypothetical protein
MGALVARWYYKRRKNQPRTAGGKFASRNPNKQKERQPFAVIPPVDREGQ